MIVDSSALVALVLRERGFEACAEKLDAAENVRIGAPTLLEGAIVLHGRTGGLARTVLARFLEDFDADCVPFGERHWPVAHGAFARYGKGVHPAGLNFGDCLTYAVAKVANEPLLCLGDDFAKTDLALA